MDRVTRIMPVPAQSSHSLPVGTGGKNTAAIRQLLREMIDVHSRGLLHKTIAAAILPVSFDLEPFGAEQVDQLVD